MTLHTLTLNTRTHLEALPRKFGELLLVPGACVRVQRLIALCQTQRLGKGNVYSGRCASG